MDKKIFEFIDEIFEYNDNVGSVLNIDIPDLMQNDAMAIINCKYI